MSQKFDSPDHRGMGKWIVSSFPIPGSHVMIRLFKTVVNIGPLLPISFCASRFLQRNVRSYCIKAVNPLPINFVMHYTLSLCASPPCQGSAGRPCLLGWSGESSHVKDMQLISAAQGVMSLWSRRPTMAGLTTRSVMLTHSRWKTSTATSLMPTRLYHKGKVLGRGGILFHTNINRSWGGKVWSFLFSLMLLLLTEKTV